MHLCRNPFRHLAHNYSKTLNTSKINISILNNIQI